VLRTFPELVRKNYDLILSFFSCVCSTSGSGDQVGRVILVLRTFPELVGRAVQNLVEIGLAVRA